MRQVLSTAIVALIVGALAGVSAGAIAQSDAERTVTPAAVSSINAHRVDGKHAVGFTNRKLFRRNKLVATNKQGYLPSNIVQPLWGLIQNKPAGFADGVDDEGVIGLTITTVSSPVISVPANGTGSGTVSCPAGSRVIGGGVNGTGVALGDSYPNGSTSWFGRGNDYDASAGNIFVFAVCLTVDPDSAVAVASRGKIRAARNE